MNASLLRRYRLALGCFVTGLVLSGLTAFPLVMELHLVAAALGIAQPADYAQLTGLSHWIARVLFALEQNARDFPFLAYGTDWLAFGHLCIAVFFVRPFFKPLESGLGPEVRPGVLRGGGSARAGRRSGSRHPFLLAPARLVVRPHRGPAAAVLPAPLAPTAAMKPPGAGAFFENATGPGGSCTLPVAGRRGGRGIHFE